MTNALWYRNWLDTRWRFLVGLLLLAFSAIEIVLIYPSLPDLLPLVPSANPETRLGRLISEAVELTTTFPGYIWSQMYRQQIVELPVLFAALLGTMNPIAQHSGRGTLFLLSLPVSRARLFSTRATIGLLELLVLAFIPAVLVTFVSPSIEQSYSIVDGLAHALCLFITLTVFFSIAAFLSAVFDDIWRPLLITCFIAALLALSSPLLGDFSLARVMSGESYFYTGTMPWVGLALCVVLSASVLYAGVRVLEGRDY